MHWLRGGPLVLWRHLNLVLAIDAPSPPMAPTSLSWAVEDYLVSLQYYSRLRDKTGWVRA